MAKPALVFFKSNVSGVSGSLGWIAAGIFLLVILLISSPWVFPPYEKGEIIWEGKAPTELTWPFLQGDDLGRRFSFVLKSSFGPVHPSLFLINPDDQLLSVRVNGVEADLAQFPIFWNQYSPSKLNIRGLISTGTNTMVFQLKNEDGPAGFRIHTHPLDLLCVAWTLVFLGLAAIVILLLQRGFASVYGGAIGWVVFGGIVLRILYWCATPYYLRCYDLWGHIEYAKYIADHLALPRPELSWETHQPPLYYLICGLWMKVTGQQISSWLDGQWTVFSLILSLSTMLISAPIAACLFVQKDDQKLRILFLVILACFPGLIFQATRISNDVLFAFLSFLWLWMLLRWWKTPSWNRWIAVAVVIAITFLTKNGALVLAVISLCCSVFYRRRYPLGIVLRETFILILVSFLIAGWYQLPKMLAAADPSAFMVGKFHLLDEGLRIPRSFSNFVTFNPVEVVRQPFNHSWLDEYRRVYFPEYFFKSALFGEWPWGRHLLFSGRFLVIVSMVLVLSLFWGIREAWKNRWQEWTPIGFAAIAMMAAQILYAWKEPFSCNQDFRYFIILTVPIAAFVTVGFSKFNTLGSVLVGMFCAASMGFLVPLLYL